QVRGQARACRRRRARHDRRRRAAVRDRSRIVPGERSTPRLRLIGRRGYQEDYVASTDEVRDVIIIGGGPAGYTAALYAARAELSPLVIEGFQWGGQLMITSDVENYPGYADGVMGPEMMQDFRRQAERFGAEFVTDDVTKVDFSERPFRVWVDRDEYRARSVIVATGASARWLGLESEQRLQGRGVSACATCDGAFFKEKDIVV